MPNIVLVGFKEKAEDMRNRILAKIRAIGEIDIDSPLINSNVTIDSSEVKDIAGNQSRIRIESPNEVDFEKIIDILRTLKMPLNIDTLKLHSYREVRPQRY